MFVEKGNVDGSPMSRRDDGHEIDTDRQRLDVARAHEWISTDSYWAKGRPADVMNKAIERTGTGDDGRTRDDVVYAKAGSAPFASPSCFALRNSSSPQRWMEIGLRTPIQPDDPARA